MLRNFKIAQIFRESSIFLDEQSTHSDVIRYCEGVKESLILRGYKPNILINKTNKQFIISKNVLYVERMDKQEIYLMPIAPKVAIVMMPLAMFNTHIKNGILEYANTIEKHLIERLNNTAYYTEKETSNKFVLGCKEELERLQKLEIKQRI